MKFLFWFGLVMMCALSAIIGADLTHRDWLWVAGDTASLAGLTMTTIILHKKAYP